MDEPLADGGEVTGWSYEPEGCALTVGSLQRAKALMESEPRSGMVVIPGDWDPEMVEQVLRGG